MPSAYVSHSIRGKKGKDATKEDMELNNKLAMSFAKGLRRQFPTLELYVPAEHDEFIIEAYYAKFITEKQILAVDCTLVSKRNFLIAYTPDGFISQGMKVEIDYAQANNISVVYTDGLNVSAIHAHLHSLMR